MQHHPSYQGIYNKVLTKMPRGADTFAIRRVVVQLMADTDKYFKSNPDAKVFEKAITVPIQHGFADLSIEMRIKLVE